MTINTTIASLSQTAALNGPDGSADLPSTLDDALRYHGAFIAQLRDGAGYTPGAPIVALGFTPVQQGTGPSQTTNVVKIGWSAGAVLRLAIDATDYGATWPHSITGNAATATNAVNATNASNVNGQVFSYVNSSNQPTWLWGTNASGSAFVANPLAMTVGTSNACNGNAASANSCSGNAATASNAAAVNGISGWSYSNNNNNPAYIWCTEGSAGAQHLTTPGSLSVNFANSSGSCSGNAATASTASNSNALGGQAPGYYINNAGSAVINIRNTGAVNYVSAIGGFGDVVWGVSASDARLKTELTPVEVDSLADISRIEFTGFRFRTDVVSLPIDDGHYHTLGYLAQQLEEVRPDWVSHLGTWLTPKTDELLLSALHALKQAAARIATLEERVAVLEG